MRKRPLMRTCTLAPLLLVLAVNPDLVRRHVETVAHENIFMQGDLDCGMLAINILVTCDVTNAHGMCMVFPKLAFFALARARARK
eukprot:6174928-Pleurochrysis_carterae.AAC.1